MIKEFITSQPKVKACKLDKQLSSYGRLKFDIVFHQFWMNVDVSDIDSKSSIQLLVGGQMLTRKDFDIPANHSYAQDCICRGNIKQLFGGFENL